LGYPPPPGWRLVRPDAPDSRVSIGRGRAM